MTVEIEVTIGRFKILNSKPNWWLVQMDSSIVLTLDDCIKYYEVDGAGIRTGNYVAGMILNNNNQTNESKINNTNQYYVSKISNFGNIGTGSIGQTFIIN